MSEPIDKVVELLNRALEEDKNAMFCLLESRVPCNQSLADDPFIQVRDHSDGTFSIGVLGLIVGVVEAATGKRVGMQVKTSENQRALYQPSEILKFAVFEVKALKEVEFEKPAVNSIVTDESNITNVVSACTTSDAGAQAGTTQPGPA